MKKLNSLVSIIMPCYNAGPYIAEAIDSILKQTYANWELLVVDDCSQDKSAEIIHSYCKKDKRIRYHKTKFPSGGAAAPRNIAIQNAKGKFIAFLDSDDVWLTPTKLEQQLELFSDKKTAVVYSNYEKMNEKGKRNNRVVVGPSTTSYKKFLKESVITCCTGMYDAEKVGKVYFQEIGHEDYVMWLSILKQGYIARNTNAVMALYRVQKKSLSGNKVRSAKWRWNVYRNVEKLNMIMSLYYFFHYCVRSGFKFLK